MLSPEGSGSTAPAQRVLWLVFQNLLESSKLPLAAPFTQTREKDQREWLPGSSTLL